MTTIQILDLEQDALIELHESELEQLKASGFLSGAIGAGIGAFGGAVTAVGSHFAGEVYDYATTRDPISTSGLGRSLVTNTVGGAAGGFAVGFFFPTP